jgi:hypothetical protein
VIRLVIGFFFCNATKTLFGHWWINIKNYQEAYDICQLLFCHIICIKLFHSVHKTHTHHMQEKLYMNSCFVLFLIPIKSLSTWPMLLFHFKPIVSLWAKHCLCFFLLTWLFFLSTNAYHLIHYALLSASTLAFDFAY